MASEIVIPEVGEVGMEVTFVTWYRAEGDEVTVGEPLFQLDTQKTLFDVEALASGRLSAVTARPGDLVEARQVIAVVLAPGESAEAAPAAPESPDRKIAELVGASSEDQPRGGVTPDAPLSAKSLVASRTGRPAVSPRARAVARELDVDLGSVVATGDDGMITEGDVRRAIAPTAPGLGDVAADAPPLDRSSRVRRAVADLTIRSWTQVPHFYVRLDADLTTGLTRSKPFPLVVGALARALRDRPEANVGWGPDGTILPRNEVTIGILVDTPDGLLLPAIHEVDRLAPADLAAAIREASERARAGKLTTDDFAPRSATVSNLGMFAVDDFAGIVATPDPFLLSIGRAVARPVWDGSIWQPRSIASLTLSADHRILDGADAGRLMTALEARITSPDWLD